MQWYYTQNGQQQGPVTFEALCGMIASRQITPTELVWREGMTAWTPVQRVPDFSHLFAASASPVLNAPVGYAGAPQSQLHYAYAGPSYNGQAITAFVLSLLGIVFCGVIAIPGFILGMVALNNMKRGGNPEGRGLALAAAIIGGIATGLMVVGVFCLILAAALS